MFEALFGALATALLGGAGWLIKRWLDKRSGSSRIEEARSLVALHREMKDGGLSLEAIDSLKESLLRRRREQAKIEDEILQLMEVDFVAQADMTQRAISLLEIAQIKLRDVQQRYLNSLDPNRRVLFQHAQKAWHAFSLAEAALAASLVEGGTMYPLVYAGEQEELTILRTASIEATLRREAEL